MLVTPTPTLVPTPAATPTPDVAALMDQLARVQAAQYEFAVYAGVVVIGLLLLLVFRR